METPCSRKDAKMVKPSIKLVGQDGNAFSILGRCQAAARKAGWTQNEVDDFMNKATSGDYNYLLRTVMEHFECDKDADGYYYDDEEEDW